MGGLRVEEDEEGTHVEDSVTVDEGEDVGDVAAELSPADVARLASPPPFSSSAVAAPLFSSSLPAASVL